MALFPDFARPLMSGVNVKTPRAVLGAEAYRLTLYPELGRDNRSVLVVGITLQFQFEPADNGLKWFVSEPRKFANTAISQIKSFWDEKFRITTDNTAVRHPFRDVGVMFSIKTYADGWHLDDDIEVVVKKVPEGEGERSKVHHSMGNAWLNSEDIVPIDVGGSKKRPTVVHEFGHMLGLADEYDRDPNFITKHFQNRNWLNDTDSIMNRGWRVRPRHYVPFATWLTQQLAKVAKLTTSDVIYKVDGLWDSSNARL